MATIPFTPVTTDDSTLTHQRWAGLANGDNGEPATRAAYADRTVLVQGTFGVGGAVLVEGSMDGVIYVPLHDTFGNALSFTAAGTAPVAEIVRFVRPRVTAGDGSTSITVNLLGRAA